MIESRHQEYVLQIAGPSAHDLTNYLAESHGWVFSTVSQDGFFSGHAIGYCTSVKDVQEYAGLAISTDQTRVVSIEPLHE